MVFQRRQAEEPTDAAGFLDRGNRYGRNGVYHRAIQDFTTAIEMEPELVEAWYNRGCSWYEVGELENAIADLTRAIELAPTNGLYYGQRALGLPLQRPAGTGRGGPGDVRRAAVWGGVTV